MTKLLLLTEAIFVKTKLLLSDKSNFVIDKITFVWQNQLLSDKINFCLTKSTFVWQKSLLSDKSNFVVDKSHFCHRQNYFCQTKVTFVGQKWLLLDKICFCQQKYGCYKRRPIGGGPPPPGLTPAEDLALALNKTRPVTKGLESGVDTHIPQVQPGVLQQVVVAEDGILHLAESYVAPVSGFEFVASVICSKKEKCYFEDLTIVIAVLRTATRNGQ